MSNITANLKEKPLLSSIKAIDAQNQTFQLVNNDASDHEDLPPSFFPCLDSRSGASNTWQASEVPFKDVNLLRAICQQNSISPSSLFQAAWVLVLQCYIGDPDVCFAFCFVGENVNFTEFHDPDVAVSTCQARLGQVETPLELLKHMNARSPDFIAQPSINQRVEYGWDNGRHSLPANTCMLYQEDARELRPGLGNLTLQRYGLNQVSGFDSFDELYADIFAA